MSTSKKKKGKGTSDAAWWQKNFPTVAARDAADRATDKLDVFESMSTHIDYWLAAYAAAGGKRGTKCPPR